MSTTKADIVKKSPKVGLFGRKMERLRLARGLNKSEMMNRLQIARQTYYDWLERDDPTDESLRAFGKAFEDLDVDGWIGEPDEPDMLSASSVMVSMETLEGPAPAREIAIRANMDVDSVTQILSDLVKHGLVFKPAVGLYALVNRKNAEQFGQRVYGSSTSLKPYVLRAIQLMVDKRVLPSEVAFEASRLGGPYFSQESLAAFLNGEPCQFQDVAAIAQALGVSLDWLAGLSENEKGAAPSQERPRGGDTPHELLDVSKPSVEPSGVPVEGVVYPGLVLRTLGKDALIIDFKVTGAPERIEVPLELGRAV